MDVIGRDYGTCIHNYKYEGNKLCSVTDEECDSNLEECLDWEAGSKNMGIQTTLEETATKNLEIDDAIPFSWDYGMITKTTKKEKEKFASKHCAFCGSDENVDYEKLSGGRFNLICKDCAVKYVKSAKRMLEEKEIWK